MKKKISTYKLLRNILPLPDDIIYLISKFSYKYTHFNIKKKRRIKVKLPREKRLLIVKY